MSWKENRKNRREERTKRVEMRQNTKQVAYASGIDPNKAVTDMFSSLGQSASNSISAVYGGGLKPGASAEQLNAVYGGKSGANVLIWVVVGLGALLMFKKR